MINKEGQVNNILGEDKSEGGPTKAIIFKEDEMEFQEWTEQLDAYLSVC